jgi:hypothetical protein
MDRGIVTTIAVIVGFALANASGGWAGAIAGIIIFGLGIALENAQGRENMAEWERKRREFVEKEANRIR